MMDAESCEKFLKEYARSAQEYGWRNAKKFLACADELARLRQENAELRKALYKKHGLRDFGGVTIDAAHDVAQP